MKLSIEEAKRMMDENGGDLDLRGTPITELPDNLKVVGYLDLERTPITELPENLEVGGWLDLRGTAITELPDTLKVGGNLDLLGTNITELPDNLKVGDKILRYEISSERCNVLLGNALDLIFHSCGDNGKDFIETLRVDMNVSDKELETLLYDNGFDDIANEYFGYDDKDITDD